MKDLWSYLELYPLVVAMYGVMLIVYFPLRRVLWQKGDRFDLKFIRDGKTIRSRLVRFLVQATLCWMIAALYLVIRSWLS